MAKNNSQNTGAENAARTACDGGFAIAPILYVLGLVGVGAGALFSGYSQILRSNQQVTQTIAAKNDLQAAAVTLAATAKLGATDNTVLCLPSAGYNTSTNCSDANTPVKAAAVAAQPQLPANASNAGSAGSPTEVGVFTAGAGVKPLDPWGHYYVYCRWENHLNPGSDPGLTIMSAGADGNLSTTCGSASAQGDDFMVSWPVATAVNRSAVWQTVTAGTQTQALFGQTGSQLSVDALGNLYVPGTLTVVGTSNLSGIVTAVGFSGPLTGNVTGNVTGNLTGNVTGNVTGNISGDTGAFTTSLSSGGTLTSAGLATFDSLSVTHSATIGENVTLTNGDLTLANTRAIMSLDSNGIARSLMTLNASNHILFGSTAGTKDFKFYSTGANIATLSSTGDFNVAGGVSGGAASFSSLNTGDTAIGGALGVSGATSLGTLSAGQTTLSGDLGGVNAVFSGSVTANSFIGNFDFSSGGSINWGNIVLPLANGGTGYAATSALDLLGHLGGRNASNINAGTLGYARLDTTGITNTGGPYNQVYVDAYGRVTSASLVSATSDQIADGNGNSVTVSNAGGGQVAIAFGGVTKDVFNSSGWLGLGTSTAHAMLDVYGGNAIVENAAGTSRYTEYATTVAGSPVSRWRLGANSGTETGSGNAGSDFVIQNYDDAGAVISTTTPALTISRATGNATFQGTVTATDFVGNFSGTVTGDLSLGTSAAATNPQRNGEAGTGLFSPASGVVGVATGGAERLRVDSSGNVGIGTTNPGATLEVNGKSSGASLNLVGATGYDSFLHLYNGASLFFGITIGPLSNRVDLAVNNTTSDLRLVYGKDLIFSTYAGGSEKVRVTNGGSVGIGTTSPQSRLHVYGGEVQTGTAGGACAAGNAGAIRYASNTLYYCDASSWLALGTTGMSVTNVDLGTQVTTTNPHINGDLTSGLYTPAGSTVGVVTGGAERVRVDSSGHVGIGTNNPSYALSVVGDITASSRIGINDPFVMGYTFQNSGKSLFRDEVHIYSGIIRNNNYAAYTYMDFSSGDSGWNFYTTNSARNAGLPRLSIRGAGDTANFLIQNSNVGVGSATPTQALDVVGIGKFSAALIAPKLYPTADSTTAVQINKADGTTNVVNVDTTNSRLGIGTATPGSSLHVYGGEAQVGTSGGACAAGNAGAIRYASNTLYYCDASSWLALGTSGSAVTNVDLGTQVTTTNPHINGDLTSGLYTPAGSTVGVVTGGVERLRVDSSGNVGIGSQTPAVVLDVAQTSTSTAAATVTMHSDVLTANPGGASSSTFRAGYDLANLSASQNATALLGRASFAQNSGTGTVSSASGSYGETDNNAAGTISTAYGSYGYAKNANAAGAITTAYGSFGSASNLRAAGTGISSAFGAAGYAQNLSTGTVASAYGSAGRIVNTGGGTVTNAYGLYTDLDNTGSTVTNWYGVYVGAISGNAPATNRYPLYIADTGTSYFAGSVALGTATAQSKLHVYGGEVQTGTGGGACAAGNAGAIRYASNTLYYCDASSWLALGTTGMSVTNVDLGTQVTTTNPHINGDLTSGLYTPAGSTVGIVTGGAERVRVDSSGNVGIGSTNPGQALDVVGTGKISVGLITPKIYPAADSTSAFQINKADGTTNVVNVDTNNSRVGIGTALPSANLHVLGGSGTGFEVQGSNSGSYGFFVKDSLAVSGLFSGIVVQLTGNSYISLPRITLGGSDGSADINSASGDLYLNQYQNADVHISQWAYNKGLHVDGTGSSSFAGKVGIGTSSPATVLDVNGSVAYRLASDATTTGSQDDVNLGAYSAVRYNGSATATFTGIAGGADGRVLYIHNPSSYTLTLSNQSASSAAANRIVTGTGSDLPVSAGSSVTLQYDAVASRWRVTGSSNSANTLAAGTTGQVQFNGGTNLAADSNLFWDNTGKKLGIGTATPGSSLHVYGGEVQTGTGGGACAAGNAGAIRYASNTLYYCDASSWLALGTTGMSVTNVDLGTQVTTTNPHINGDLTSGLYTPAGSTVGVVTGGVERVRVDSSGNVGIGSQTPAVVLDVAQTSTSTAAATVTMHSDVLTANPGGASSSTFRAGYDLANLSASQNATALLGRASFARNSGTGTVSSASGAYGEVDNDAAGTISTAYGSYGYAKNANAAGAITTAYGSFGSASNFRAAGTGISSAFGAAGYAQNLSTGTVASAYGSAGRIVNTGGGTVTNAYGLYTDLDNTGSTVTNWYGVYVAAVTGAAPATNRYPLYIADTGTSYFAGSVAIGTTSAGTAKLNVAGGNVNIDNTTNASQSGIITKNGVPFIHDFNYGNNGTVTPLGYNTFVGVNAGNLTMGSTAALLQESSLNTGIGNDTLSSNTTGFRNTASGARALYSNTTGQENTASGYVALNHNTTGSTNTASGTSSLYSNTEGNHNTANGYSSLYANITGEANTVSGSQALSSNTTGNNNIAIGYGAGYNDNDAARTITGSGNILIGVNVLAPTSSTSNYLNIGNAIMGDMAGPSIGIGTASPASRFHVYGGEVQTGTAGGACAAGNAGAIRYASNTLYYCDASSWLALGTTGSAVTNVYLGTQVTTTNPHINGDLTTGLYTPAGSTVGIVTGGIERVRVDSSGNVGIGSQTPAVVLDVAQTSTSTAAATVTMHSDVLTANPGGASSSTFRAGYDLVNLSASQNAAALLGRASLAQNSGTGILNSAYGIYGEADNDAAGTVSAAYGSYGYAKNANASGNITTAYGLFGSTTNLRAAGVGISTAFGSAGYVQNLSTGTIAAAYGAAGRLANNAGGAISDAYGLYTDLVNTGSTVTNWYGVYVGAISGNAPATNRYPLYIADTGTSYFAGSVAVGTTSAGGYKLNVNGTANFSGTVTASTVTGLSTPTNASDAANKAYVDAQASSQHCRYEVTKGYLNITVPVDIDLYYTMWGGGGGGGGYTTASYPGGGGGGGGSSAILVNGTAQAVANGGAGGSGGKTGGTAATAGASGSYATNVGSSPIQITSGQTLKVYVGGGGGGGEAYSATYNLGGGGGSGYYGGGGGGQNYNSTTAYPTGGGGGSSSGGSGGTGSSAPYNGAAGSLEQGGDGAGETYSGGAKSYGGFIGYAGYTFAGSGGGYGGGGGTSTLTNPYGLGLGGSAGESASCFYNDGSGYGSVGMAPVMRPHAGTYFCADGGIGNNRGIGGNAGPSDATSTGGGGHGGTVILFYTASMCFL